MPFSSDALTPPSLGGTGGPGAVPGFVPPNPGGRRAPGVPDRTGAPAGDWPSGASRMDTPTGTNPLVAAANPLLNALGQLRATVHHADPAGLREQLTAELRQFELRAQKAQVPLESVVGARYCLCTALDEAAALTPWGGAGGWSAHSLLVAFHNETWGGEKFFQLLQRLMQQPAQHIDLLELMYFCLALGFEGRYRVLDQGRSQLDALRQRLADTLRAVRGEVPRALSAQWQPQPDAMQRQQAQVPVWVLAAVAGVGAALLFWALSWSLGRRSDAVFATVEQLRLPRAERVVQAPAPAPKPRLARFLEPEIQQGLVMVADWSDRSVVTLRGDGLFESGAAAVMAQYEPVLARIATALNAVEGRVLVSGYTDNVPTHRARYASNWDLSVARAQSVAQLLSTRLVDRARVAAIGRGEADPIAPNDTPANRARNRRVEITLLLAPPSAGATAARANPPAAGGER